MNIYTETDKKAKIIVFEGTEGTYKSTQVSLLAEYLKKAGYKVLVTKEPGTPLSPLTMELRNIMLNNSYEQEMTQNARELISQAIRSIHIEKVIIPNLYNYDYIIQDRGIMSGLAYGESCGNNFDFIQSLSYTVTSPLSPYIYSKVYDHIILLQGNVESCLNRAKGCKQEFEKGDAMEAKGLSFMKQVEKNFNKLSNEFSSVFKINIEEKTKEQILNEVISLLGV